MNLNLVDPKSTASQVDDLIAQAAQGVMRHALTAAAGALVTAGAITSDQQSQLVAIGSGIGLWLAGVVWSIVQKRISAKR